MPTERNSDGFGGIIKNPQFQLFKHSVLRWQLWGIVAEEYPDRVNTLSQFYAGYESEIRALEAVQYSSEPSLADFSEELHSDVVAWARSFNPKSQFWTGLLDAGFVVLHAIFTRKLFETDKDDPIDRWIAALPFPTKPTDAFSSLSQLNQLTALTANVIPEIEAIEPPKIPAWNPFLIPWDGQGELIEGLQQDDRGVRRGSFTDMVQIDLERYRREVQAVLERSGYATAERAPQRRVHLRWLAWRLVENLSLRAIADRESGRDGSTGTVGHTAIKDALGKLAQIMGVQLG